jgi:hypothetical protein
MGTDRLAVLREQAASYVGLACENIQQEFPTFVVFVARGPEDLTPRRPRTLHPAFYGSFDWHSCVEMFWVAARLLRLFPGAVPAEEATAVVDRHLTPDAIAGEVAFFAEPAHRHIERPYGWGWLLALADELARWDAPEARRWAEALAPLTRLLARQLAEWLAAAPAPIRTGLHGNSAFGLRLALPYAARQASAGDDGLLRAIEGAAVRWYGRDRAIPVSLEPGGSDFLSPSLVEAELMSRVLPPSDFVGWWRAFWPPHVLDPDPDRLPWQPLAVPPDPDGQTSHLLGLNLSRAWCLNQLAAQSGDAPWAPAFAAAAGRHAAVSLPRIRDGYMTSHWLVAYAVLYLSE